MTSTKLSAFVLCGCTTVTPTDEPFGDTNAATDGPTEPAATTETAPSPEPGTSTTGASATTGSPEPDDGSADSAPLYDVSIPDFTPESNGDACKVSEDGDAPVDCEQVAPADAFDPVLQWSWQPAVERNSIVIPLVANLTDDNDDGEVDLCDVPDVVVNAYETFGSNVPAHLYVLSGDDGSEHFRIDTVVHGRFTPALGDIDDDGLAEIVHVTLDGFLIAFENDGSVAWTAQSPLLEGTTRFLELAIADLDADGAPEILAGREVYANDGDLLWTADAVAAASVPTAADIDDDGALEVIYGTSVYEDDGTLKWTANDLGLEALNANGSPAVANLDEDDEPEILVFTLEGIAVLEHDGTVKFSGQTPVAGSKWSKSGAVHDLDGDGEAEFVHSSGSFYVAYEADASVIWSQPIVDASGVASSTAFDFIGSGVAEAAFADEQELFVYDGAEGDVLLQEPRSSLTMREFPVVADIDNDRSAEILVVSNGNPNLTAPTLQAFRDADDRWVPARRIWNQHSYHVTNVREDGTIPIVEAQHWSLLNTFRTQAQSEGGQVCIPAG